MKVSDKRLSELADDRMICNVSWDERVAIARELMELRAAAAKRESCPAVVRHYTGCKYPVIKVNSLEVVIAGDREDADELAEYINSLSAPVPEGWKLVPVEPDETMCDIAHIGIDPCTGITDDHEYYSIDGEYAAKVYRAMIELAPEPAK